MKTDGEVTKTAEERSVGKVVVETYLEHLLEREHESMVIFAIDSTLTAHTKAAYRKGLQDAAELVRRGAGMIITIGESTIPEPISADFVAEAIEQLGESDHEDT